MHEDKNEFVLMAVLLSLGYIGSLIILFRNIAFRDATGILLAITLILFNTRTLYDVLDRNYFKSGYREFLEDTSTLCSDFWSDFWLDFKTFWVKKFYCIFYHFSDYKKHMPPAIYRVVVDDYYKEIPVSRTIDVIMIGYTSRNYGKVESVQGHIVEANLNTNDGIYFGGCFHANDGLTEHCSIGKHIVAWKYAYEDHEYIKETDSINMCFENSFEGNVDSIVVLL